MLEKLKLNSTDKVHHTIKLNDVLDNSPPTLKSLSLSWVRFCIDLDSTYLYNIKTLSFFFSIHFMTRIPTEILKEIFIHLHQYDKLKCMLVCRHWKNTVEHSSLYHTLYINSSAYLKALSKKLENLLQVVRQTKQVIIHFRPFENEYLM